MLKSKIIRLFKEKSSSKLVKDAGSYTFFQIIDRLLPFMLLPVVTRALAPDEYGVFVLFQALVGVVLPLMTLSVDSSILVNYYKVKIEEFKNYFSSRYLLLIISSSFVFITIILFRDHISKLVEFPSPWIISILLLCFFQFNSNLMMNMFQMKREPKKYGLYSISLTALKNVLMLVFVLVYGMKWRGMILGYLVANGIFFIISLYHFKSDHLFTSRINREYIKDNMKVGYPLSLHQFGTWGASSATRVITSGLLGATATGSFNVGATIGMIVLIIQDSFNKAYTPFLFGNLNNINPKIEKKIIKITYSYNVLLLILALGIGVIGSIFLGTIFGSAYAKGKDVVLFMALAYAFNGMYKMHVNFIFYTKRTYFIFLITVTTGLLNIILCYIFIGKYGMVGGALSLCVINLIGYIFSWYVGNKVFPLKWFKFLG